ncbi:hypothetical protein CPB85DRAFT_1511411 [Mucidula mucida]|nr:hypothetical protein CPB85DRAFT_1511411 [Mucidula mucida]
MWRQRCHVLHPSLLSVPPSSACYAFDAGDTRITALAGLQPSYMVRSDPAVWSTFPPTRPMARGRRARHRGATAAPFSPKGAVQVALDEIATLLVMLDGDGLARRFSQRVGLCIDYCLIAIGLLHDRDRKRWTCDRLNAGILSSGSFFECSTCSF